MILVAIFAYLFQFYWVYIPALLDYIKYPLPGPYQEMIWSSPTPSRSNSKLNENQPPNIVIILTDDLGFNDISFYSGGFGHGRITTPHIDSIGNDGIAFTQAYAGHATCAPSRASLLTGKYPTRVGYEYTPSSSWGAWVLGKFMNNGPLKGIYHSENAKNDSERFSFPLNHQLIPEALRQYGYNSIQLGKWHNGYDAISSPINRGFNETLGFNLISSYLPVNDPNSMNCYFEDTFDRLIWSNVRYGVKANNGKYFEPNGEYLTDYLAKEATKAIEANKENPFFLYVALSSIHTPLQSLKSDYDKCVDIFTRTSTHTGADEGNTATGTPTNMKDHNLFEHSHPFLPFDSGSDLHCNCVYGGMILALDRAVGTILNSLETNHLSDNTIVIFTSDNGGTSVANQRHINFPFRGWKATFFEGGLRVPLLMKWPKYLPKYSMNSDDIVSHVDIFPTLLHAAAATTTPSPPSPATAARDEASESDMSASVADVTSGDETTTSTATTTATTVPSVNDDFDGVSWLPHILSSPLFSNSNSHRNSPLSHKDSKYCETNSKTHDTLFWRSGHYSSLRYCQWKYQISSNPSKVWLYDLVNDPQETLNLATLVREDKEGREDKNKDEDGEGKRSSIYSMAFLKEVLEELRQRLEFEDRRQVKPLWDSLSETPVLVDKIFKERYVEGDEYVYWPN
jgi:arylsulfatase A-like enzyme